MPRGVVNKFNRGVIDKAAMAREEVKRVREAAEIMRNFVPERLGPMSFRPGTFHINNIDANYHRMVPFVRSIDDAAIIEFHSHPSLPEGEVNFIVNDVFMVANANTSWIGNAIFSTGLGTPTNNWADASDGGFTDAGTLVRDSTFYGYVIGDGSLYGRMYQTLHSGNQQLGVEHSMYIGISDAPVIFKIGTTGLNSDDIFVGTLKPGYHCLTFTPSSYITITIESALNYRSLIEVVTFFSGGIDLNVPVGIQNDDELKTLRYVQSGDIVYCAYRNLDGTNNNVPFAIEHRGDKSWSMVYFEPNDGPFETVNTDLGLKMSPNALSGDVILNASKNYFTEDHVGALIKIDSVGQTVQKEISGIDEIFTDPIRVTGVGSARNIIIWMQPGVGVVPADFTVTLQESFDGGLTWDDSPNGIGTGNPGTHPNYQTTVALGDGVSNSSVTVNDTPDYDNAEVWYRVGIKSGNNPGAADLLLELRSFHGSIQGIGRITSYIDPTTVEVQTLVPFGSFTETADWYLGSWNKINGYPNAVDIAEGRLWFAGGTEVWGSQSDAYYSFDRDVEGDSASIHRTVGFGPTDPIKWLKYGSVLIAGTTQDELAIRSSSYGEIMTPTSTNIKRGSSQGSDNICEAINVDDMIYFVSRSRAKLYQIDNFIESDKFTTTDTNVMNKNIVRPKIARLAVLRQPETRIFALLDDGTLAVYTVDPAEDMAAWSLIDFSEHRNTKVIDIAAVPGEIEDELYLITDRGLSHTNQYTIEEMARYSDCEGGSSSKHFDDAVYYTSPGTTITGLNHFNGEYVGVWADGQDRGDFLVASNQIVVPEAWTDVVVGARYTADYKSSKLVGYIEGSVLSERKRIVDTGVILENYYPGQPLKIGASVAKLKPIPGIKDGKVMDTTQTIDYDELPFDFDGETDSDPRFHIKATGPVKLLAITYGIEENQPPSNQQG